MPLPQLFYNNFQIDWLEFKITNFSDAESLGQNLFDDFHLNVFIKNEPRFIREVFLTRPENQYQVILVKYSNQSCKSMKVEFSGRNADYAYSLIKQKRMNIDLFGREKTKLSRLDIKCIRQTKQTDPITVKYFLETCKDSLIDKFKRLKVSLTREKGSLLLKMGARSSPHHYRIYEKKTELHFELELKKKALTTFQKYFFSSRFVEFEETLVEYFCAYSKRYLAWKNCYMDWLVIFLRQKVKWEKQPYDDLFVIDYIKSKNLESRNQKKYFFRLLQFLSFLHTLKGLKRSLDEEQVYYTFQFPVSEFLSFLHLKRNQYQRINLVDFLNSLQTLDPLVTINFAGESYRNYVCFPFVKVNKVSNIWMAKITIVRELYEHCYPFLFPANFLLSNSSYDIDVRLELIQSMTQPSLEKIFDYDKFLTQYKISHQNKRKIKSKIIESFGALLELKRIEPKFKLIYRNHSSKELTALTLRILTSTVRIYFYEKEPPNEGNIER